MKTKYYRYTLKGEHSADDAQRKIGDTAAQGLVVRVESSGGETHVYIASEDEGTATAKKAASTDIKVKELSEKDAARVWDYVKK